MLHKTYHDPGYWERELPAWNDAGCFPDYQSVRRQKGRDCRMVLRPSTDGDRIRCLSSTSCLVSDRRFPSCESSSIASYPLMTTWPYNSCHCTSMYRDKRSLVPNRDSGEEKGEKCVWVKGHDDDDWRRVSGSRVVSATKAKKAFQEKKGKRKEQLFPGTEQASLMAGLQHKNRRERSGKKWRSGSRSCDRSVVKRYLLLVDSEVWVHLDSSCMWSLLLHRDVRNDCSEQTKNGASSAELVAHKSSSSVGETSTE